MSHPDQPTGRSKEDLASHDTKGAARTINDREEKYKIEALREFIGRSLVGFERGSGSAGTGTLVQVGEDILIVTAGHVVQKIVNERAPTSMMSLPLVTRSDKEIYFTKSEDFMLGYQVLLKEERWFDVGLIQLKQDVADMCREYAVDISMLVEQIPVSELADLHAEIAGFPQSLILEEGDRESIMRSLMFATNVWSKCKHAHPDSKRDGIPLGFGIHVDWSGHWDPDTGLARENPAAGGMSGGPLWAFKKSTNEELWFPAKKAVLVGINFWWDHPDCIRCVPISEWLGLVESARPNWSLCVERARTQSRMRA